MVHDPEALAQRRRKHAGPRRRADQRKTAQRKLERLGVRAAIDDEIDLKVLHRRIEELFYDAPEPMNLIDEEHVAFFERRKDADEIFGLLERRPARRPKVRAQLARDESCQRRLAEPRRAVEQNVFERLAALLGGVDRDVQVLDDALLPDVLFEGSRT